MVAGSENPMGIYISIPFCRSKCTYCNFASGVYPAADHERYVVVGKRAADRALLVAFGMVVSGIVD